ncbi:MAG: hypothetical protein K0R54_91 [Clostridiaceae bacterium]|nr:hypothetical protein [Clostridiaceae bacterium]
MENTVGTKIIGNEYEAINQLPKILKEGESSDISKGEKFKVVAFEDGMYKLLNLNLETDSAWFAVDQKEFDYIVGKN